jgi:hypothetical protein
LSFSLQQRGANETNDHPHAACLYRLLIGCDRDPQGAGVSANEQQAEALAGPPLSYRGSLQPLDVYRGKELAKLNDAQVKELLAIIKNLIPEREYRDWFDFHPWHLWDFPNQGRPALVLFEVDNTGLYPGSTGIRINVFEKTRTPRSEVEFWTGHRCYLQAVSLQKQANGQDPLIVLETGLGPGPGPNVHKQLYAHIGNRFDLVRLENADGKATRNLYYVNHFACGPLAPNGFSGVPG